MNPQEVRGNIGRVSSCYKILVLFLLLVCSRFLFSSDEGHRGFPKTSKRNPVEWTLSELCITKGRHMHLSQHSVRMKEDCQWCFYKKTDNVNAYNLRGNQRNGFTKELAYVALIICKNSNQRSDLPVHQQDVTGHLLACLWMVETLWDINK